MLKVNPNILFIYLSTEFGDDEQLSLEDIFELNANDVDWKMVCIENTPIHHRVEQFGKAKVIALKKIPSENFDRGMKDLLIEQINLGANVVHVFGSNYLGSILPWLLHKREISVVVSEGPHVKKTIWHLIQSFFYSRVDTVIVPSVALKKRIEPIPH